MPDSDRFWDIYWEVRLQALDDLGKKEAILVASKLVRSLAENPDKRIRLLELGCGEGQVIGSLVEAHMQVSLVEASCGVDYSSRAIEACRRAYPGMTFIQGDITDPELMGGLGSFEIVILVNVLHEVFSAVHSPARGEIDVQLAKASVEAALKLAAACLAPGGTLLLFDGLETPEAVDKWVQIRFRHVQARRRFETFVREYHPFRIKPRTIGNPSCVELSWRDFTRYITKSIFLEKQLWQKERLESYQYFNKGEFRSALARLGLTIQTLHTLTVNYEKWNSEVEIITPGADFPAEHILILAQKPE